MEDIMHQKVLENLLNIIESNTYIGEHFVFHDYNRERNGDEDKNVEICGKIHFDYLDGIFSAIIPVYILQYNLNKKLDYNEFSKERFENTHTILQLNGILSTFKNDPDLFYRTKTHNYLKSRGVTSLIHFTPVDNLKSILEKGIVPVDDFIINGIDKSNVILPDGERIDGHTDGSCFSISFPNYKMLYPLSSKKDKEYVTEQKRAKYDFAVLEIDTKVLLGIPSNKIYYYKGNAATKSGINNRVFTINDMFQEHYHDEKRKIDIERENLCIPDYYTTDPQAELIIAKTIDQKYIRKIYTKSYNDVDINDPRITVNPIIFGARKDYEFWITKNDNNDTDNMEVR